ncbi:MAG TPA: zinc ribbon domain-containing protein [Solirubrobacteraceae bacterium]|jgi:putative FmdB family regulatory protein|nr:zinc ribbon domain-containing protein [Solirubrobacteraceae bacterium]
MPIYEYRRPDGSTFEVMQSFAEDPLTHDPESGVAVSRVLHAPAVHFKGKGFYNTDYGTRKRQRENAASSAEGSSAESGSGGETASGEGAGGGDSSAGKDRSSAEGKGGAAEGKSKSEKSSSSDAKTKKPVAAKS